jgi:hypothetical protein
MGTAPAMTPDFGNAGTVNPRTDVDSTPLHVANGEYLDYSLITNAPAPVFAFRCQHRKWLTNADFPSPQGAYSWQHFRKTGDEDGSDDRYGITMLFLGAPAKYTLKVIKRDKNGAPLATLKDIDFSSTDPSDFVTSALEVIAI